MKNIKDYVQNNFIKVNYVLLLLLVFDVVLIFYGMISLFIREKENMDNVILILLFCDTLIIVYLVACGFLVFYKRSSGYWGLVAYFIFNILFSLVIFTTSWLSIFDVLVSLFGLAISLAILNYLKINLVANEIKHNDFLYLKMILKIFLFSLLLAAIVTTLSDNGRWLGFLDYIYPWDFDHFIYEISMFIFNFLLFFAYLIPVLIYRKKMIEKGYSSMIMIVGIISFNFALFFSTFIMSFYSSSSAEAGMFFGLMLMAYAFCGNIMNLIFTSIMYFKAKKNYNILLTNSNILN